MGMELREKGILLVWLIKLERISSSEFEEFFNAHYSEDPLFFDGQDKERTKNELSMVQDQSSGVNHQVQLIVDAEANASNTLNSGYRGYNNGEGLAQNFAVLNEEFGMVSAPIAINQDHILQSQSFGINYEELSFDASILDIGFEGCIPEDCPELPNNMENDKREKTSTSTKQSLVAASPLTNESLGLLSKEERRREYNRKSAQRSRERKKARVNELIAMEKLFKEVKPLLLKILIADTGNIMSEAIFLRERLKDLISKNQYAAFAFGISPSPGFNRS